MMRTPYWIAILITAMTLMLPSVAHAGVDRAAPTSWGTAMPDSELSTQRGTYAPLSFGLTVRNVAGIADAQRDDMAHVTGSMARVTMDIWWSTTGLGLIAANVRATTP